MKNESIDYNPSFAAGLLMGFVPEIDERARRMGGCAFIEPDGNSDTIRIHTGTGKCLRLRAEFVQSSGQPETHPTFCQETGRMEVARMMNGLWHQSVFFPAHQSRQWQPCEKALRLKLAEKAKQDGGFHRGSADAAAVDYLLDLVNCLLPDDFVAFLRGELETIRGEALVEGVGNAVDGQDDGFGVHRDSELTKTPEG